MKKLTLILTLSLLAISSSMTHADERDIEATTPNGDKVILHGNGRWDFVDSEKDKVAKEVAKTYPINQGCPPGSQGSIIGFGRCILPGDKDYNRQNVGKVR